MSPKPEYWTLAQGQFQQIKSQLDELGKYIYSQIEPIGFKKFESPRDWLGFTIERKSYETLTIVALSLIREKPLELELVARKWLVKNPRETCIELYQKSFYSMEEVISCQCEIIEDLKKSV